jgi:hypothetical protein
MAQQPRTFNVPQDRPASVPGATDLVFGQMNQADIVSISNAGPQSAQGTFREVGTFLSLMDRVVNVRAFGAEGDGVADDTAAIQAAIEYVHETWGPGVIIIPPGEYKLLTEIIIEYDDISLIIQEGATLLQYTFGYSFIQVINADRVTITGGGRFVNPITKTEITGGAYNGNPARSRASAVYVTGCNFLTVSNLSVYNSVTAVHLHPDVPDALTTRAFGIRIMNLYIEHFDFGIVASNQQNLLISNLISYWTDRSQGNVDEDDNGPAPHAIYLSGKSGNNLKNENIVISGCSDFFNAYSSSYKAKFSEAVTMTGISTQLCMRGFDVNGQQVRIVSPVITYPLGQPCLNFGTDSRNIEIVSPLVTVYADVGTVFEPWVGNMVIDTDNILCFSADEGSVNITVTGGRMSHDHQSVNSPMALCAGDNIRLTDVEFNERGINAFPVSFRSISTNSRLIRPIVTHEAGSNKIADISTGALNTWIEIDPMVLNFDYVNASVSDSGTGTVLTRIDGSFSGTWTPTVAFVTNGDFVPTYNTRQGWYRKEGEWVTVGFTVDFDSNAYTGATTGDFRLSGLPFTPVAPTSGGYTYAAALGQFRAITGTIDGLGLTLGTGETFFSFRRSVTASGGGNLTTSNVPASTAGFRLIGQLFYKTTDTP